MRLNPTDRNSRFELFSEQNGIASRWDIAFGPVIPGRTDVVKYKTNLTDATWQTLDSFVAADFGQERVITDLNASGNRKFYTIEIIAP